MILFIGNVLFFLLLILVISVHAAKYYRLWDEQSQMVVSLSSVALTGTAVYRNFTEFNDGEKYLTNPGKNFSLVGRLERIKEGYKFIVQHTMQIVEIVDDEILLLTPAISFDPEPFTQIFSEEKALDEITLEAAHVCLNEMLEFEFYNEGMNTRGYDVNTREHDVNARGYDMDTKGYDVNSKGYDVNTKGYDVNTKGYDGRTKEYDINTRGYDVSGGQDASACSSSSDLPPELPPRDYSKHDMDTSCSQEIYELPVPAFHSPVNEDDCSSSNQLQ